VRRMFAVLSFTAWIKLELIKLELIKLELINTEPINPETFTRLPRLKLL